MVTNPWQSALLPANAATGPVIQTVNFVNRQPVWSTPGVPTRTFGLPFAKGAIPSGQAPVFVVNGQVQPFSANPANARRYWPDGSLMFCAFALRPTVAVAPGGTFNVKVLGGGASWPNGARTVTADVYPQNFQISCPPYPGSGTTTWSAFLSAANAANIVTTRHWLTGDAGDVWGFTIAMSQTAGGAPHGLLYCDVFMHVLNDGDGNQGGFRFWADLRQPKFTNITQQPTNTYLAPPNPASPTSGIYWQAGGEATHPPPNWAYAAGGLPFTTINGFTTPPNSIALQLSAGSNAFFFGKFAQPSPTYTGGGSSGDICPVYVTGNAQTIFPSGAPAAQFNASLASGVLTVSSVTAGTIAVGQSLTGSGINVNWGTNILTQTSGTPGGAGTYTVTTPQGNQTVSGTFNAWNPVTINGLGWFILTPGHYDGDISNTEFIFTVDGAGGKTAVPIAAGAAGTITPVPMLQPFARLAIGGADGEYLFFRGSGSIAQDTPLDLGVLDQKRWIASGTLPPWDTTLSGSVFGGPIQDTYWGGYPYTPYAKGGMLRDLTTAADGAYLAPITNDGMLFFYNGSLWSYRSMLFAGLSIGNMLFDLVDGAYPNSPPNLSARSYTAIGASASYLAGWAAPGGWYLGPYVLPSLQGGNLTGLGYDNGLGDHWPNLPGFPYLVTGRLELLDRVLNQCSGTMLQETDRNSNAGPVQYFGIPTGFDTQARQIGWLARNLGFAAAFWPQDQSGLNVPGGLDFMGSQTGKYLTDLVADTFQVTIDQLNPASGVYGAATNYLANRFSWIPAKYNGQFNNDFTEWEGCYICFGALWGAVAGVSSAVTFLANQLRRWKYIGDKFGYWCLQHYYALWGPNAGAYHTSTSLFTDDDHWMISPTNSWNGGGAGPTGGGVVINWQPQSNPGPGVTCFSAAGPWLCYYTPQNGDRLCYEMQNPILSGAQIPAGPFTNDVPYIFTDLAYAGGNTYNFNLTQAGSSTRLSPTNSGSTYCQWFRPTPGNTPIISAAAFPLQYNDHFYAVASWFQALIGAGLVSVTPTVQQAVNAVLADVNYRQANTPGYTGGVWYQSSPNGTIVRYAHLPTFKQ